MRKTMLDYVVQTPSVLTENLARSQSLAAPLIPILQQKNWRILRLVASGSSSNAAWCARPALRHLLGMEVLVTPPHTFAHYENDPAEDELIMVISQSGCSTNALEAVQVLRDKGHFAIGITAKTESDMKDCCDLVVDYGCGLEDVGYVTKGVSTLALFLQLFALEGGLALGRVTAEQAQQYRDALAVAISSNEACIAKTHPFIEQHYMELSSMGPTYTCGSGPCFGAALEGALKLGETVQIPAFAYETEEYIHGPELQLSPHHTVFFLDDGGSASQRIHDLWAATCLVTHRSYLLTCCENPPEDPRVLHLANPGNADTVPLCFLPFFQILSYRMTEDKHLWHKHPLCAKLEHKVSGKSASYVHNEVL